MIPDFDNIPINIIRSQRKSVSIEITKEGILIRAPRWMSHRKINALLWEKQDWIRKHWEKMQKRAKVLEELQPYSEEEIKELVKKARVVIVEKVQKYAPIVGVDYGRIAIRNQRTRWGSCSGKGNLNFNCMLMKMPDEVIDYVVVHELCHRKHMNHSAEFYAEVERVLPEYRKYRKWLKENGGFILSGKRYTD